MRYAAVSLLFCCALGAQSDPATLSEQGKQAMAAGRFGEAAGLYAALVERIPDNPGLLLNQGMALAMAGRDAEAVVPLKKAVSLAPELFPAWLFLGGSQLRLGRSEKAVEALEKARALDASNLQVRQFLGEAYAHLNRHRKALVEWKAIAELQPSDPTVWALLVQSHQALASEAFDKLERQAPESAYMVRLLADLRLALKQYPSALYLYRLALERDPAMRGLHSAIAEIYRATGHPEWAGTEQRAEAALGAPECEQDSLECDVLAGRLDQAAVSQDQTLEGLFWRAKANSVLADRAFTKLQSLPESPRKHELLATLLADQQRFDEAAVQWKQALEAQPGNPQYQAAYATQLYLAGRLDEAQPRIEKLLAASPADPQWNFFLGDIHLQRLDAAAAIPLLEKAVAANLSLTPARHALGRAYMATEQPEKAIPHLEAALEIDRDGSLHYQLAQAYIRTGRRDEAREPLEMSRRMQQAAQAQQAATQEMTITAPPPR